MDPESTTGICCRVKAVSFGRDTAGVGLSGLTPSVCLYQLIGGYTLSSIKTHADRLGIATGVTGETVRGVLIKASNQRSKFVKGTDVPAIKELLAIRHEKYRRVNIPAVVFGLHRPDGTVDYALYSDYEPKETNA